MGIKMLQKFVAIACAMSLFMTTPNISAYADETYEEIDAFIIDEENEETDRLEEAPEPIEIIDEPFIDDENVGEAVSIDESIPDEFTDLPLTGASTDYNNEIVYLKDGVFVNWIDRVNLPDYALALYENMIEASDNDGNKDWLIDTSFAPKDSDGDYSYVITEFSGSAAGYSTMLKNIDTDFSNICFAGETVYGAFLMDHPEVFWLSDQSNIAKIINYEEVNDFYRYTCKVVLKLTTDDYDIRCESFRKSEDILKGITRLKNAVSGILSSATGDEYHKIAYFNSWLTRNNEYNRILSNGGKEPYFTHLSLCALEGNKGDNGPVCEGYANAFKVLCDAARIPCATNSGTAINSAGNPKGHRWNYVLIEDRWYAVDVTWNDAYVNGNDTNGRKDYLLVGADTIVDGQPFLQTHPITNQAMEDGICFTNGPALNKFAKKRTFHPETDSWNIENYVVYQIPLTKEMHDALMHACGDNNAAKESWEHLINPHKKIEKFSDLKFAIVPSYDGQCFGIAESSLLVNQDKISLDTIQTGISNLYEATKTDNVESLIGYCHLLQYFNYYASLKKEFAKLSNMEKINRLVNAEFPIGISFGAEGHGYHHVVGYELEYGNWTYHGNSYDGRVKTADSNHPYSSGSTSLPKYYFYFNTKTGIWEIPYYYDKYKFNSTEGDFSSIIEGFDWYEQFNIEDIVNDYRIYKSRVRTRVKRALLLNYGGKEYTINSNKSLDNGNIDATYDIGINDNSELPQTLNINMKQVADFSIEPAESDDCLDIGVLIGDAFVSILGNTYTKAIFKADATIDIIGLNGDNVVSLTKNSETLPWDTISFSIDQATELSTSFKDEGIIISADNLQNLCIVASNGSNDIEAKVVSNEDSLYITEKDNAIEVFEDLDDDGHYTDKVNIEMDFSGGKDSGTCGEEAKWHLSDKGVLTVYGKGEMSWNGSSAPWSSYRLDIKEVNVLPGITNIADRAFYECYNLKTINLSDTVQNIGFNAFFGCLRLLDAHLPENLTEIKANAFSNCTSMLAVTLPNNLTSLGQGAFYKCTSLQSVMIPGSISKIGNSAFDSCSALKNVVVSDGVKEIESAAFYKCSNLESVILPASIKWMGPSVFYGCSKLKTAGPIGSDANIEYGWTTELPKEAFYGCDGLEEIELSSSLISVPESAFGTCSSLKSIIIPQSVVSIGESAFQECIALSEISISENVKSIGAGAFSSCTGLTEITLPNISISFGNKVFAGCSGIKSVTIPENMKNLGQQMFEGCNSLESVQLSGQTTSLPYALFKECTNIKSIDIPRNVTSLEAQVFNGCSNLISVTIPLSLTTIGKDAYAGCEKLTDVYYTGIQSRWEAINISDGNENLINANIHYDSCQDIRNCEISLSETQFVYDGEVKEPAVTVKYQGKILKNGTDYTVTYENNKNAGTAKVVIEGAGVYTGKRAQSFTINKAPQSVTAKPLTYELPVNLTTPISKSGFGAVEYISSDESIATVDRWGDVVGHKKGTVTITVSFSGGKNYLPASTSFTMEIVDVYLVDSDSCGEEAIWNYYNDGVIRITGKGMITLVQRESGGYNWNKFNNIDFYYPYDDYQTVHLVIIEDGITAIDEYTFAVQDSSGRGKMSDSPEEIIISDTVKSIGKYAFYRCEKLKNIEIGSGLSELGNYALTYCTALEQINVSEENEYFKTVDGILYSRDMTTIYKIPSNCGFKSYTVPDGVVTMKRDSAGDIKTLKKVTIPCSVKVIEQETFDGCTGLTDVYYAGSKSEWNAINIASGNEPLTNAAIHFAVEEIELAECTITLSKTKYTYNGSAWKPTVSVKNGDTLLTSGTDYTVTYANNKNAGTAKVMVTGLGKYIGTVTKTFTINKASPTLTFADINIAKTSLDEPFTNLLEKKTDGTVTFSSADVNVAAVNSSSGLVTIKGTGETTITATAAEGTNYKSGSASYTLTVAEGRTDISECTITLSRTSYTYNGNSKKPSVAVKNGTISLTSDTDYTVSYSNNKNAGIATVIVTGKGNYLGTGSVTFTIKKATATLSFAKINISKKTTDAAFINNLTKTTDGFVTFKSSDTNVVSVDSGSGLVTIKSAGKAIITATAEEGKNYKASSASYTVTIEAPAPSPTPTPTPSILTCFSDVQDPTHPYYKAILWAADAGITKGYSDGTFGIDRSCTRGEMMMFLWKYAGRPAPKAASKSPFKDVPKTHTFYKAILWGYQKGITKGYSDGSFGINRNVSRGESMMFLWRLKGKPAPKAVSTSPFKDVPKTHAFYNAILWGSQKGITKGYTSGPKKGNFGINDNCTRGQIVTFLYRAK